MVVFEKVRKLLPDKCLCVFERNVAARIGALASVCGDQQKNPAPLMVVDLDFNGTLESFCPAISLSFNSMSGGVLPLNSTSLYRLSQGFVMSGHPEASGFIKSINNSLGWDVFVEEIVDSRTKSVPVNREALVMACLDKYLPEYTMDAFFKADEFGLQNYIFGGKSSDEFIYGALIYCASWLKENKSSNPVLLIHIPSLALLGNSYIRNELRYLSNEVVGMNGQMIIFTDGI